MRRGQAIELFLFKKHQIPHILSIHNFKIYYKLKNLQQKNVLQVPQQLASRPSNLQQMTDETESLHDPLTSRAKTWLTLNLGVCIVVDVALVLPEVNFIFY